MSDKTDDNAAYYATLGLPPDATLKEVKARYRELNDAYLKLLELSRKDDPHATSHVAASASAPQAEQQPKGDSGQRPQSQATHTEPVATLKDKLASGKIDKAQFERLAKERYNYLKNKPFSDLTDSEFDERLKGFEGLKVS